MFRKIMISMMLSLIFIIGFTLGRVSVDAPGLITEAKAHTANDCSGFEIKSCSYVPGNSMYPTGMYTVGIENSKHDQTFLIKNDRWYPAESGLAFVLQ